MSGSLGAPTVTKVIGCIIYLQIMATYAHTKDITLTEPNSIIKAEIGDELLITCLGTKCQDPVFTWASLSDNPLSGTVAKDGQISVLTMKISSENLDMYDSYRCTVHCDNPPAEKGFKVIAYSFPKPILTISSLVAGEQSRITCTIPDAYPFYMFDARILIGEMIVAEYEVPDEDLEGHVLQNISLSHNLMLTDKNEAQEIKCEAELRFQENEFDPISSDTSIQLNLLYPPGKPTIIVFPDTNVKKAENISLTCTFESRSPVSVQWVKVDKDNELVMSIDEHLTIPNAEPEDSGMYICRVQNNIGNTSSHVLITVQALPEKPTLTIYPTTKVQIGQSITIECLANESDVHVTLWKVLKDADNPLKVNGKLVIQEADPIDTAIYKCIAENYYGVSEASESLTVEYPPIDTVFTSSDEKVNEGGEVTLTCTSNGVPEPSFLLYHLLPSGDRDLLSEGPVVTLTNVTSGVYQCEATNSLGSKKEKLELRLQFPPRNTFLNIMPSLVTREGESIHFRCTSEAYPAPRLVLKKETETGLIDLEAKNGQYSITHVTEEHAGRYICESSNVVGKQEAKATVTVQVPPKNTNITITPSSEVREGDFIDIICVSEASPAPRLSLKVRTEDGVRELVPEGGRYQIAHAGMKHSGTYICESTNIAGQQQVETTLTIQVPPKKTVLTISPSPVLKEGESGHIRCISEAFPAPRLVLKKQTEAGPIELEVESGEYSLTHVAVEHAGTYICESTNVAGQQIAETTLTIQAPPKNTFISITPSSVVKEGDDVQIQCISEAYPSPWLVLMMKTEHGLIRRLESEDGRYNITKAEEKNTGTYICESTNVFGQQTAEAALTIQKRQQSPRFDYVPPAIIGSVVLVTAGFIGIVAHHLKQAKVQGSYSLVKALRNKV
ncbi:vascular cell adhesion protein 1 isoform X2 [Rana temporaria]|uniref:vascular cell adhesion protein 1 isoform X2 n=1 Tax=Rana temporaria TaxID=8407 RepID=UPI001AAC9AEC|nr:vascular cell adhesion protein 1 isoform X2 [Rana temporaria]